MKFACLVYHESKPAAEPTEADLAAIVAECEAAGAWRATLESAGHHVFTAGLQSVRTATTVRKQGGNVVMTDGPFAETKEVLGGFTIIEAHDKDEALVLASRFASALVTVEVRPLLDPGAELTDPLDQKIAAALRRQPHPDKTALPRAR